MYSYLLPFIFIQNLRLNATTVDGLEMSDFRLFEVFLYWNKLLNDIMLLSSCILIRFLNYLDCMLQFFRMSQLLAVDYLWWNRN